MTAQTEPIEIDEEELVYCERCEDVIADRDDDCTVHTYSTDPRIRWRVVDQTWCLSCAESYAHRCSFCNTYYEYNLSVTGSDRLICYECVNQYDYRSCNGCDLYYDADEMYWDDDDEEYYCEACRPAPETGVIHRYGFNPPLIFRDGGETILCPGDGLFVGIELEIETEGHKSEAMAIINRHSRDESYFWMCSDGSLYNGIEIITHPATLKTYRTIYPLGDLTGDLARLGCRSHDTDTCGLHMHMSRAAFTTSHLARFVYFVNHHEYFLRVIARRGSVDYCRFRKNKDPECANPAGQQSERSEAVNLQNRNTVEVRIYKGTLRYATLMACIENTFAMYAFTKDITSDLLKEGEKEVEQAYLLFISDHAADYPALVAFLCEHGVITGYPPCEGTEA